MYANILVSAQIFEFSAVIYNTFNSTQDRDMLAKYTQKKDAIRA